MATSEHLSRTSSVPRSAQDSVRNSNRQPRNLVNYALTALAFDLVFGLLAIFIANVVVGVHLFASDHLDTGLKTVIVVLLAYFSGFILVPVYSDERPLLLYKECMRAATAVLVGSWLLQIFFHMADFDLPSSFITLSIALSLIFVLGWRLLMQTLFPRLNVLRTPPRLLIVGVNETTERYVEQISQSSNPEMTICGFIDDIPQDRMVGSYPVIGTLGSDLFELLEQYEIEAVAVVVPNQRDEAFTRLFEKLQVLPSRLLIMPEYDDLEAASLSLGHTNSPYVIMMPRVGIGLRSRMLKRLFDIAVSLLLLFLAFPTLLFVAIAIKLDSPGPIFYRQLRVGEHCRRFRMIKFRSMVQNADKLQEHVNTTDSSGNLVHKRKDDPRVTRVGRFIRKYSIDELPQLVNVLVGEMSLIGPRPEMPWLVRGYEIWQYQRFVVPPGITGWWQVNGRSDKPMHLSASTEEDLYYIKNYSLLLDIKIMVLTIPAVLMAKGAF